MLRMTIAVNVCCFETENAAGKPKLRQSYDIAIILWLTRGKQLPATARLVNNETVRLFRVGMVFAYQGD